MVSEGFANFYRKLIRNFNAVAAPLHVSTSSKVPFPADMNFDRLKDSFFSSPVLTIPEPDLPFVVKVDASDSGVGAT